MKDKTTPSNDDPRKEELHKLLSEQEELSEKAAEESRKSLKVNTQRANQARLIKDALHFLPAEIDYEFLNDAVQQANFYQRDALERHFEANSLYVTTSSTSGTVSITAINRAIEISPESQDLIVLRTRFLDASGSIDELCSQIKERINRLNLDLAVEGKKPTVLLEESVAAYNLPVTKSMPVASSLLPLRSCTEAILANLLRMRPDQEKVSGHGDGKNRAKVISIGRQLKWSFLGVDRINFWADQWDLLHDDLSDAKSKAYSWSTWSSIVKKTLVFINGFLGGLDPAKFTA